MTWREQGVRTYKLHCWYEKSKVCYDKKGAISAANRRYKEDKIKLRPYWCDRCNFWHLTKQFINEYPDGKQTVEEINDTQPA